MKVSIQNYKGFEITFDLIEESFCAQSEEYDRSEKKKSFAAAKKYVDDFIKDNSEFRPVWIIGLPGTYRSEKSVKLIGIRKDGRFVYEDKDGNKKQLSDYEEKDFILVNPENDKYYAQIKTCKERIENIRLEIDLIIKDKIIKNGLEEIKNKYIK